jgi:MFS family permease
MASVAATADGGRAMVRAEDIPMTRRLIGFGFLLVFDFFYGWSWNTVDLLRPDIRAALGLTLGETALMYTAQSFGALVGAILIGQLADRFGRRNAMFCIMVGYALSLLAGVIVTSHTELLIQRFVLGLFLGGVFPVAVGLYTSLFDKRMCGRLAGFYNGTFNGSVVALGFIVANFAIEDYRVLLWLGAIPPLVLAPLTFLLMPNDRTTIPFGFTSVRKSERKLPAAELFTPEFRSRTLRIMLMVGLNFFAYQAFAGWQTTYLQDTLGFSSPVAKGLLGWQFVATIIGGFAWGWAADRYGRRANAFGLMAACVMIGLYLAVGRTETELRILGFIFGLMLPSSVIWGPWIAEMFPPHLRSTAASLFNWGRIISLFAPPITAAVAEGFGMVTAMALGALSWFLCAMVWRTLPETLERRGAEPAR